MTGPEGFVLGVVLTGFVAIWFRPRRISSEEVWDTLRKATLQHVSEIRNNRAEPARPRLVTKAPPRKYKSVGHRPVSHVVSHGELSAFRNFGLDIYAYGDATERATPNCEPTSTDNVGSETQDPCPCNDDTWGCGSDSGSFGGNE